MHSLDVASLDSLVSEDHIKKHASVDMQSGLINKVAITPANVTDALLKVGSMRTKPTV